MLVKERQTVRVGTTNCGTVRERIAKACSDSTGQITCNRRQAGQFRPASKLTNRRGSIWQKPLANQAYDESTALQSGGSEQLEAVDEAER